MPGNRAGAPPAYAVVAVATMAVGVEEQAEIMYALGTLLQLRLELQVAVEVVETLLMVPHVVEAAAKVCRVL